MKRKTKIISILIILTIVLSGTISTARMIEKTDYKNETIQTKDWTIIYYLCGDLDGYDSWLEPIIENLTKIKSDENINIVVLYDGFGNSNTFIYYIDEEGNKEIVNGEFNFPDEIDSGSPIAFELFCTQAIINYPAKNYCVIPVMSGGTGWQLICFHDSEGGRGMSMPVFRATLANIYENTNTKIDILYTSCAMNMIEVAYEIKDFVNYIVGTQDCLANQNLVGRFYKALLDLKNNSKLSPEEFASKAPDRLEPLEFYYQEEYNGGLPWLNKKLNNLRNEKLHSVKYYESTAVINTSNIVLLKRSIDNLAKYLILTINNKSIRNDIKKSLDDTKKYGKCMSKFRILSKIHNRYHFEFLAFNSNIDLHHFAENLKKNTDNNHIKNLCHALMYKNNLSISSIKKVLDKECNGISIYFPPSKSYYNRHSIRPSDSCHYEDLKFSIESSWDEFIRLYLKIK